MTRQPRVGLVGGTFDPVHAGHLAAAQAAARALHLERVRFIPASRPPHRTDSPRASGYHRVQMIALAVADTPGWEVSDLELTRDGPSYTYDTLTALADHGLTPREMFFITGADAFADVASWSRYPDVLNLAHFVVVARPGAHLGAIRERLPNLAARMIAPGEFRDSDDPRIILLEAETPDVSSTTIRRRLADSQSIRGLVPDAVAAYIDQNLLYRTAGAPVA